MLDLTQFVPLFGNFAFVIVAFVVALSIIVAIHEYGHYIVGRWCGIHAEVFSLGFGPKLFSRVDKRGTRWQVAALPLGGYVKFLGDANAASVGTDGEVPEEDRRRTMLGAPLWARTLTVAAGPVFNFILAIVIFAGVMMYEGRSVQPLTFDKLRPLPAEFQSELQSGDVLIAVEGFLFNDPDRGGSLGDLLPIKDQLAYTVERDGREIDVMGPHYIPPAVSFVVPRSAADNADIKRDDVITAVDGMPVYSFAEVQELVPAANGAPMTFTVWRDGEYLEKTITPRRTDVPDDDGGFRTQWLIGISGTIFFEEMREPLSLWESLETVWFSVLNLWDRLKLSVSGLVHVIRGDISTCNLSGPVGIAQASASMAEQGAQNFILFIAAISAAVGMVNLFPIPVLDGGHLLMYAFEAVTGRPPDEKALNLLVAMGLALIATMMLFTVLNDTVLCP